MKGLVLLLISVLCRPIGAQSLEIKVQRQIELRLTKKICEIQLKESLLPLACYQLEVYDEDQIKHHCFKAVRLSRNPLDLQISTQERKRLGSECLKRLDKKLEDLKYKKLKDELLTSQ